MGTFITTLAQQNPEINYVGIEIDKNVMIRVTEKVLELGKQCQTAPFRCEHTDGLF